MDRVDEILFLYEDDRVEMQEGGSTDRFNKVRPVVDRDFSKTSKVGGAPKGSTHKIVFKKSKKGTLPKQFEGTKFYPSETKAKQALKDKQKFILEAREKRKKPPKIVDPKEYAEDVRTRKPGVGLKKISTITKDNVVTKTYKDRATGKVTKRYSSKLVPGEFKSFAAAAEANKKYRIKNPVKNLPPADPGKRYLEKKKRQADIVKRGGYAESGPFTGTSKIHKGHAGNIRGSQMITGDKLIFTPAQINQAMAGQEGKGRFTDLDYKINEAEKKINKIKKSKLPEKEKKRLLEIQDNKLINYSAQSDGYKVVKLSGGGEYGGSFRKQQSIDPMDEFKGKTEKDIGKFLNKYKNMKITDKTPKGEVENVIKANIFLENLKEARNTAARVAKDFIDIVPLPGPLKILKPLKKFADGGRIGYRGGYLVGGLKDLGRKYKGSTLEAILENPKLVGTELGYEGLAEILRLIGMKDGGIASLPGVKSGPPPESGPNPQGLENVKYYVTNT